MVPFDERLLRAVERTGTRACVGLDPHLERFPEELRKTYEGLAGAGYREAAARAVLAFNGEVLRRLEGKVPAVKPQLAFYEELGAPGWRALEETCAIARQRGLLVVADAKRGDIESTARAYAHAILADAGPLGADAITISPWLGVDAIEPFFGAVREGGKGLFVLVRTTNPASALLQAHGEPTAAAVLARTLGDLAERPGQSSIGAVVGAQIPRGEVQAIRAAMPRAWFLVPGYGAQGGRRDDCLTGARPDGTGVLVSASRSVLYPTADDGSWSAIEAAIDAFVKDVRI
jgi:orotidine-5'-phosphate decarboxylase